MDRIYIALFLPVATQTALQFCLTFTHSGTHSHTPTAESTMKGDGQLVGSSKGELSCSGTPRHSVALGGAGDRTGNLPVIRQPTAPTEPHAARRTLFAI